MQIVEKIKKYLNKNEYKTEIKRLNISKDDKDYDRGIKKVMNLLNYTKKSEVSYNAGQYDAGYHSFEINNYHFKGQRNPKLRFKDLPFSLKGLSVLDIGCNQGGMLYSFANEIKYGIGIDYDQRMINAANKIKSYSQVSNIDYYVFDLEKENLGYIQDFLPEEKVDVVLLLSVCMWINNWKEVIDFSSRISDKMIFETNGKPEYQLEQIEYLKKVYKKVGLIHERSEDDLTQKLRQLFYCTNYEI